MLVKTNVRGGESQEYWGAGHSGLRRLWVYLFTQLNSVMQKLHSSLSFWRSKMSNNSAILSASVVSACIYNTWIVEYSAIATKIKHYVKPNRLQLQTSNLVYS